jgi:hypothetical protein
MQEPTQQPAPRKTIHIGYIIPAIVITIVAIVCAVVVGPTSTGPVTPTPTPIVTPTLAPTPTPILTSTISITAPATANKSKNFHVFVNVSTVSNLAGAQFDIKYDPKVITVVNVSTGQINGITIPMSQWKFIPANTQGTVRIVTLDPTLTGINGEGCLADITFLAKGTSGSTSNISFIQTQTDPESNLVLGETNGDEIPSIWINGSVTIQ